MSAIKAVIFDCFGVMYVDAGEAYTARFPQFELELLDLGTACNRGFIDQREYIESVSLLTGDSFAYVHNFLLQEHTLNEELVKYAREHIKPARKVGLLSNIGRGWIDEVIDKHFRDGFFDAVVLSGEEGMAKPDTDIYLLMALRLGVRPEECVMVDDREVNCFGAETAGMQSVFYRSFKQAKRDIERILGD